MNPKTKLAAGALAAMCIAGAFLPRTAQAAPDPEKKDPIVTETPGPDPVAQGLMAKEAQFAAVQEAADNSGALGVGYDKTNDNFEVVMPTDGTAVLPNGKEKPGNGQPSNVKFTAPDGVRVHVRNAAVDGRDLAQLRKTLESKAFDVQADKYSWAFYFDTTTDQLVISTDAPRGLLNSLEKRFPRLIRVDQGLTGLVSRQYDLPAHWGGASITNGSGVCTSGFTVKNSVGTRYMVTAGHCFLSGQSVWSTGGGGSFGYVASRFNYPSYDMELLGGGSYGPYIYEGNLTGYGTHVISAGDPGVTGYTYCSSGQTSAESCNHTVFSLNATVCAYGSLGCSYGDIAASNTSVTFGDSGSPFFFTSGGQAYIRGLTIAISPNTMYAEKWSSVANHFGVSILT